MSYDESLVEWVREALEPLGPVTLRKMMGGATLYLDGNDRMSGAPHRSTLSGGQGNPIIFAIAYGGEIWFKADGESDAVWDAEGCERFSVTFKDGRVDTMNYRRAPADVYDDAEAMQRWARLAHAAGLRGAAKKRPKKAPLP